MTSAAESISRPPTTHQRRKDVRVLIEQLNPVLQGWGEYFRTGNAARKFLGIDRYVTDRLHRFLVKRAGRNLRAGRAGQWTSEWFWGQGLHRLRGTARYPKPCVLHEKTIGEPDAGGAADNSATQLVQVQPCQLSVSDTKRRHIPERVTIRSERGRLKVNE